MTKRQTILAFSVAVLVLASAAFYWMLIRPVRVRANCTKTAEQQIASGEAYSIAFNGLYRKCLLRHGLEP